MVSSVRFVGASGGVGTSTLALAYGVMRAESCPRSSSVCVMSADFDGLLGLGGLPAGGDAGVVTAGERLVLRDGAACSWADLGGFSFVSLDGGSLLCERGVEVEGPAVLVLRGPDYLGLRRGLAALGRGRRFDGVALVCERHRALDEAAVTDVLGLPVIVRVELDDAVARAGDAGLYLTRVPTSLRKGLAGLGRLLPAVTA